jgi:Arc/MetJ family transcription regulator
MVKKTALLLDEDKIAQAREILGTSTSTETIDAALTEIINREKRRQLIEYMRNRDPADNELILKSWG